MRLRWRWIHRLAIGLLLVPAHVAAHQGPDDAAESDLVVEIAAFSTNALIGAATAGVRALLEGRDFGQAFIGGALGGGVSYAGKRIAVADFGAAPITGRVVASFGHAMIAGAGSSLLPDSVRLPIGPFRIGLSWSDGVRPSFAVVGREVVVLAQLLADDGLRFDRDRSLAAATPVFVTRRSRLWNGGEQVGGFASGSLILLDGLYAEDSYRHEVVHVLQHDFMEVAWDRPLEEWLRRITPGAHWIPNWIYLGMVVPTMRWIDDTLNDDSGVILRLMQEEAIWLEGR